MRSKHLIIGLLGLILLIIIPGNIALSLDIRLKNGTYLQGEIISYDDTGFEFKRWDNNGIIKLHWAHLASDEAKRIRKFLNLKSDGEKLAGLKIYLKNSRIYRGVVTQETTDTLSLKTAKELIEIVRNDILKSEPITLDLLEVYTPEEIYQTKIEQFDLTQAENNYKLALYCVEPLRLFEQARELLRKSCELDPTYKNKVQEKITEINNLIVNRSLKEITQVLQEGNFQQAEEILQELKTEEFSSIEGLDEIIQEVAHKITEAKGKDSEIREKETKQEILSSWYKLLKESLQQVARNRKIHYRDACQYTLTVVPEQINEKIARKLQIENEAVEKTWQSREPEGSIQKTASYGEGSWLVAKVPKAPSHEDIAEFVAYKEKGRLIRRAQRIAGKKKLLISADAWWKKATKTQRANFLEAYFAERKMKVVEIKSKPCPKCHGEGVLQPGEEPVLCNRCYGKMVEIFVTYY